jgi:hypothetical protein
VKTQFPPALLRPLAVFARPHRAALTFCKTFDAKPLAGTLRATSP